MRTSNVAAKRQHITRALREYHVAERQYITLGIAEYIMKRGGMHLHSASFLFWVSSNMQARGAADLGEKRRLRPEGVL